MDGRRKRNSQRHSGIVLFREKQRSGTISWRARFIDPDSLRRVTETIPSRRSATEEQRHAWAVDRMRSLQNRTLKLEEGAPTKKNVPLEEAVRRYFTDVKGSLRPKTLRNYQAASKILLTWARARRIDLTDDLRAGHLADLRSRIANKSRRGPATGPGKSGKKVDKPEPRSPETINRELRELKTLLEHLRRLELVPFLSRDAIADSLRLFPVPRPQPEYLRPSELVDLVDSAKRHDADTFELTRKERESGLTKGTTPKHVSILPYLATVLLTGMRADEARLLRWDRVDLKAEPAGTIALRPEDVKTKHGRTVDLVVSAALQDLLAALRLRAGDGVFVFEAPRELDEEGKPRDPEPLSYEILRIARERLVDEFGAPKFTWKRLRVTCGTYLANAPGIFGAASAYREARQLGHSVVVAEKHYLGVVHVDPSAHTLEAAMGIDKKLRVALGLRKLSKGKKSRSKRS